MASNNRFVPPSRDAETRHLFNRLEQRVANTSHTAASSRRGRERTGFLDASDEETGQASVEIMERGLSRSASTSDVAPRRDALPPRSGRHRASRPRPPIQQPGPSATPNEATTRVNNTPLPTNSRPHSVRSAQNRNSQPLTYANAPRAASSVHPSSGSGTALHTQIPIRGPPPQQEQVPALPRWQPDSEVTHCPVCGVQFSMFNRKHHCRKCGRVVCNACSPHRITIPYQFIVRPPDPYSNPLAPAPPTSSENYFGGNRVRLCNPCVPDPNTTPLQQQAPSTPAQPAAPGTQSAGWGPGSELASSSWQPAQTPAATDRHKRSRSDALDERYSATPVVLPMLARRRVQIPPHLQVQPPEAFGPSYTNPPPPTGFYHDPIQPPNQLETDPSGANPGFWTPPPNQFEADPEYWTPPWPADLPTAVPLPPPPRPPQPPPSPPQRQIAEEDECPVCGRELFSRSLRDFEARRQQHIQECISEHSYVTGEGQPLRAAAPRMDMFPFVATEKDCANGEECSICLEEFVVGEPMGRLVCLCRFHKPCIDAWWERNPGRCPMHQHETRRS